MKTIFSKLLLGCALCCVTMTSCNDMLETKNFSDMSPYNFFKTEGDIASATVGIYLPCTTNWGYSDGGTGGWYNALYNADMAAYYPAGMLSTDIVRPYNNNWFDEFNVGPSSGGALTNTYNVIRFVARATDVINQVSQSSGVPSHIRESYIAELKTLRAFYMYVLLDWFGPVNVKLNPETLMDNTIEPRPDLNTYVGYIEKDLADAIDTESFPDKYNDDGNNWGRMSKAIAYALRIRLHMHQKMWDKVKSDAEIIMTMGFSLTPNYEDVFNIDRTMEHIWSIPSNTASDNFYVTEVLPSDFKKGYNHKGKPYIRGSENEFLAGWQAYCMRWDFYDTFEDKDVRKNTIICEYDAIDGTHKSRSTMAGAIPIKFTDSQYNLYGIQKAHPAIRYAEILLSYAEAVNELYGPTSEAINAVKQITDRAGVEIPSSAITGKEAFRKYLLEERGRELFCEGQRRQDLIRHGVYISRARERGANAQDYHVLYPIPQAAITEADGILEQNPGYTN